MGKYVTAAEARKAHYPFAAIPTDSGSGWEIVFPGIAGVVGFAEQWEDIGAAARTVLDIWLEDAADDEPVPGPVVGWDPLDRDPADYSLPVDYTAREVALMLEVSEPRVRQLAASRGVGRKAGGAWWFSQDDVDAMRERIPGRPRKTA